MRGTCTLLSLVASICAAAASVTPPDASLSSPDSYQHHNQIAPQHKHVDNHKRDYTTTYPVVSPTMDVTKSPAPIASVVAQLGLSTSVKAQVEAILNKFDRLNAAKKDAQRKAVIEQVFPLVFPKSAFVEGSSRFEELREVPWSTANWLAPAVITTPSSALEVSYIMRLVTCLGAPFSVRGGGHSQNPGFQSNNDGVVIALEKFNQVQLSGDKKTADVGVGLRWIDVYAALESSGLTVTGGRVPSVGVPGLILGGGISFQNGEKGLGCMGVTEFEVVLADGSIVQATQQRNPDLFWALKGGQANFGVVTRIHMLTVSNQIWAEGRMYAPTENTKLLAALMEYHKANEKDPKATLIWYTVPTGSLLVFVYNAPTKPTTFDAFADIPFLMNIIPPGTSTVYQTMQAIAGVLNPNKLIHEMRTMSSLPDYEMYLAVEAERLRQNALVADIEDCTLTMVIQPFTAGTVTAGDAMGGTPLGIKPVTQQWFLVMADWKNEADTPRVRAAVKAIVDVAEAQSKAHGTYQQYKYANYADYDQNPLASYGAGNLAKLKQIAKKYDPQEVFQKLQYGGWKVSKA